MMLILYDVHFAPIGDCAVFNGEVASDLWPVADIATLVLSPCYGGVILS